MHPTIIETAAAPNKIWLILSSKFSRTSSNILFIFAWGYLLTPKTYSRSFVACIIFAERFKTSNSRVDPPKSAATPSP